MAATLSGPCTSRCAQLRGGWRAVESQAHENSYLTDYGLDYDGGIFSSHLGRLTNLVALELAHHSGLGGTRTLCRWSRDHNHTKRTSRSGTVPTELGRLTALTYLHVDDQSLSGTLPSEMALMRSMLCASQKLFSFVVRLLTLLPQQSH